MDVSSPTPPFQGVAGHGTLRFCQFLAAVILVFFFQLLQQEKAHSLLAGYRPYVAVFHTETMVENFKS